MDELEDALLAAVAAAAYAELEGAELEVAAAAYAELEGAELEVAATTVAVEVVWVEVVWVEVVAAALPYAFVKVITLPLAIVIVTTEPTPRFTSSTWSSISRTSLLRSCIF